MSKANKKAAKKTAKKTPAKKTAKKKPGNLEAGSPPVGGYSRQFGEAAPDPASNNPWIPADDNQYYKSSYYIQNAKTVQKFKVTNSPAYMDLNTVLSADAIQKIKSNNQIVFHSVGDTGGSTKSKFQQEENVSDMMGRDFSAAIPPSFFYHLGDVVYDFGEESLYYSQFYDPFRDYNAPIFAIPGNHDGMVYNSSMKSLGPFEENFCAAQPGPAPNAGGLIRSTMNQPGVYWTLDAPFVSIIGLYSNVIDNGPGVISSQGGKYPIPDTQLDFLASELDRLNDKRKTDPRAILLAVHHPPYSGDAKHGGSPRMSQQLDDAFTKAGLWPNAVLSGHSHNYQRFQRIHNGINIPYIVAGSGGFNAKPIEAPPAHLAFPIPGNPELTLEGYFVDYGYLTITVNAKSRKLTIVFNTTNATLGAKGLGADTVVVPW